MLTESLATKMVSVHFYNYNIKTVVVATGAAVINHYFVRKLDKLLFSEG